MRVEEEGGWEGNSGAGRGGMEEEREEETQTLTQVHILYMYYMCTTKNSARNLRTHSCKCMFSLTLNAAIRPSIVSCRRHTRVQFPQGVMRKTLHNSDP